MQKFLPLKRHSVLFCLLMVGFISCQQHKKELTSETAVQPWLEEITITQLQQGYKEGKQRNNCSALAGRDNHNSTAAGV